MNRFCQAVVRTAESSRAASRSTLSPRVLTTPRHRQFASSSRSNDTATATSTSPKIAPIVDTISTLTLLEVSELVTALKTRLNITEIAMPSSSASAPAAAQAAAEEPAEEKPKEKTMFTVKLEAFEAGAKAKIIREVKAMMPNMNLVEAKKFVESVPQVLKENAIKDDAEKLQKTLQALGATISLS